MLAGTTGLHVINMVFPDFTQTIFGLPENVVSPHSEKSQCLAV